MNLNNTTLMIGPHLFNTFPIYAVWETSGSELKVKLNKVAGESDGVKYFYAEGITTGIPESQIRIPFFYKYENDKGEYFVMDYPFEHHNQSIKDFYHKRFGEKLSEEIKYRAEVC